MRFFRRLVGFLVLLFIIALLVGYMKFEAILSHKLSNKFKTKVNIEDVSFSPMKEIDVHNITVANPSEYRSPYALQVVDVEVVAPYRNFMNEVVQIDKILITNLTLTVETINRVTNWETLMANLDSSSSGPEDPNSYTVINELTFKNLTIRIIAPDGTVKVNTIKTLTLNNVKTQNGELTRRLTQAILMQLIFNIQNLIQIPLKIGQDFLNAPTQSTWETLKSLSPFGK